MLILPNFPLKDHYCEQSSMHNVALPCSSRGVMAIRRGDQIGFKPIHHDYSRKSLFLRNYVLNYLAVIYQKSKLNLHPFNPFR